MPLGNGTVLHCYRCDLRLSRGDYRNYNDNSEGSRLAGTGVIPGVERHALGLHNALGRCCYHLPSAFIFERCNMEKLQETIGNLMLDYTVEDIFNMLVEVSGMNMSKTQLRYSKEADEILKHESDKISAWKESKTKIYTSRDFPNYVKEEIRSVLGFQKEEWIASILDQLFKTADVRKEFAFYRGHYYFTLDGYIFLMTRCSWMSPEMKSQWIADANLEG